MNTHKAQDFLLGPSAAGVISRLACARLREQGQDVSAVLSMAGLSVDDVDDPTRRVEVRAQIRVLQRAAEVLGDEFLGFHLAHSFDLREIGLVYYVAASSENLADALTDGERYSRIVNEGIRLRFRRQPSAVIALDYVNVDRLSDRHQVEFWLVTMIRIWRKITDVRLVPSRLKVRHFRDGTPAEFKKFFGSEIEFGADADEIFLSQQVVSLPIVGRDSYLHNLLHQYAEEALASRSTDAASIRSAVKKVLPELLPHGRIGLTEIARKLGMSSRTLSRKLHEEGVTYAEILDELRASLARHYLIEMEYPVSKVAFLLGYGEFSSLTHAFKRWTGMTPRQFRLSQSGQPARRKQP